MGEVLHGSLLQLLLEHSDLLNIDISQGSVATRLRCGKIFTYEVSLPVKEFRKLVNICRSYGQEFGVLFFLRHSVYINCITTSHKKSGAVLWCTTVVTAFETNTDDDHGQP